MDGDTVLPGDILQFVDKLSMCQIRHLPSPELSHTCEGAKTINMRLIDHIILSPDGDYFSFNENGMI